MNTDLLRRIERHLNQVTWLLLLIWLSLVTLTIAVLATR